MNQKLKSIEVTWLCFVSKAENLKPPVLLKFVTADGEAHVLSNCSGAKVKEGVCEEEVASSEEV